MIYFLFFSLSSTLDENISAEITSVAADENASILHGEINQPRGIQFPQTKGRSFQENWFDLYNWLHYDEEKDAAFCHVCLQAMESCHKRVSKLEEIFIYRKEQTWSI